MGLGRSFLGPLSPTPLPWPRHTRSRSPGFRHVVAGRFSASLADAALQLSGVRFLRLLLWDGDAAPASFCRAVLSRRLTFAICGKVQTFVSHTPFCGIDAS